MEVSEKKSGSFSTMMPGKTHIIKQIKEVNIQLKKIEDEIKVCNERIHDIIRKEKENSPRSAILNQLTTLKTEIKMFKDEKKIFLDGIEKNKAKCDAIKTAIGAENLSNIVNDDQINQKIEQLNSRLIRESLNVQDEKRIAGELNALQIKKSKLKDMKESIKQMKVLEDNIKENKTKVFKISKDIKDRQIQMASLKEELDKIHENSKNKHPEIDSLNKQIKLLKEQKVVQLKQKEAKREELHAFEVEQKRVEKEVQIARELETQKEHIRKEIADRNKKIDAIKEEISKFDAAVFDNLIHSIQRSLMTNNYMLDVSIIALLSKYKIIIPTNKETLNKALDELRHARDTADKTFEEKKKVLNNEIDAINNEISVFSKDLEQLPPTNMELLRKYDDHRRRR